MRIAQVAPLFESVPPRAYGGTERVVSYVTDAMVAAGHAVTLFASGDSITTAELVACCPEALRTDPTCLVPLAHQIRQLELVVRRAGDFDLLHFHTDYLHFPLSRRSATPHVTTLHGRLDLPDLVPLYQEFTDTPLTSISDAQRTPLPSLDWRATVYHGLPLTQYRVGTGRGGYLAFLGRIAPEKRVDRAVAIATQAGLPLRIAAKVDPADQAYYDAEIKPLLAHPLVEFIGEIGEREKEDFLGDAAALLFPIDWPEPFGLVLIEAMACGTPVIAFRCGSVPEIVEEGRTGFIVRSVAEAVDAVRRLRALKRADIREVFERRFSVAAMLQGYLHVYETLGATRSHTPRVRTQSGKQPPDRDERLVGSLSARLRARTS